MYFPEQANTHRQKVDGQLSGAIGRDEWEIMANGCAVVLKGHKTFCNQKVMMAAQL